MSSIKMQTISHSEYLSGKYRNVSTDSGGTHEAKITYKDNGSINEDETYSDNYLRSNGLGRYAKKAETSSKSSSSSSSSKSSKSSSSGFAAFGASSSKKSSSSSSSSSNRMKRERSYLEIESDLNDQRLAKYVDNLVADCCDIYDEDVIEKTKEFGESIGISGDEALAYLYKEFKLKYDPEHYMKVFGRDIVSAFECRFPRVEIPTGNTRALLHYMRCALTYDYLKKGVNVKEWMKNLNSVITLHYSGVSEVQEVYAQLKAEIEKEKQKTKKIIMTTLKIIGGVIGGIILILILLQLSVS